MPGPSLSAQEFVNRWRGRALNERAAAQSHFNDLCEMLGVPKPTDNRITDSDYGFEARTDLSASGVFATTTGDAGLPLYRVTTGTGGGFADVWKRDHFCWEYKTAGKYRTLADALAQLRIYQASLGNPPLLVVCDIDRLEIHTNFTNYPTTTIAFTIDDLAAPSAAWQAAHPSISPIQVLRKVFDEPEWFRPAKTREAITAGFAKEMGELAIALRDAGNDPHAVAHLIMQIVFCLFAEDIGLLPRKLLARIIDRSCTHPAEFPAKTRALFKAMEFGGGFGTETIEWFNGGLFKDVDRDPVITIAPVWLGKLLIVANKDWDAVDPSIFGTLFERSLDPGKRSQIGAHYTSRSDIMLIVEPVVMQPLRRKWVDLQKDIAEWREQRDAEGAPAARKRKLAKQIKEAIAGFVDHLGSVRILDPACGSGNFLYVTIQQLLDLEAEVRAYAARPEINVTFTPRVQPRQLMGIDINDYACELARVSIWIGYLQWQHANATPGTRRPILDPLDTIENRDAILKWADSSDQPLRTWETGAKCAGTAEWPEADFIIGNPPFLGSKLFRKWGLPDAYLEPLYDAYDLPNTSDLCCYWFELARQAIRRNRAKRAGLLATQGIRGRENRTVLERIKQDGDIFMAWSDREWILDGAAVHVSIIAFDDGAEPARMLDGEAVPTINIDLSHSANLAAAVVIAENRDIAFMGDTKGGAFDIGLDVAHRILASPNPAAVSNADVVRPWVNGLDLTRQPRGMFIIDFGVDMQEAMAARYEAAFDHVTRHVKRKRKKNRRASYAAHWWIHVEPRPAMRRSVAALSRVLVTPILTKHRLFVWLALTTLPDHQLIVFARDDDYIFGVLHSSVHERWALQQGTQLETRPRYTPTTCFETFPLPWPPGKEPKRDPLYKAIAAAAKELDELRERWLNPPEWMHPIEDAVDRFEDFSDVPEDARPLLRRSAIMARAAQDPRLKKRTLTNLYNERPGWLRLAHRTLDEAVLAAYAAVDSAGHWKTEWAEAYEPFGAGEITIVKTGRRPGRGSRGPDDEDTIAAKTAAIENRKEVDEKILANLLRLNLQRAAAPSQAECDD